MTDPLPAANGRRADTSMYTALENERRRLVVWCLAATPSQTLDRRTVAAHIVAWQTGQNPTDVQAKQVSNVYQKLRRYHRQPLEETDIITFDGDDALAPGPRFQQALSMLCAARTH